MALKACAQAFLELSAIRSHMNAISIAYSRLAPLVQDKHVTLAHVLS